MRIASVLLASLSALVLTPSPALAAAEHEVTPETCTTSGEFTMCQSSRLLRNTTTTPSGIVNTIVNGKNHSTVTGGGVDIDFTVGFSTHFLSKPGEPNEVTVVQRTIDVNGGVRCHQTVVFLFRPELTTHQNFNCI
jgi:hypothetical protein